jgi:hypothetical protein
MFILYIGIGYICRAHIYSDGDREVPADIYKTRRYILW